MSEDGTMSLAQDERLVLRKKKRRKPLSDYNLEEGGTHPIHEEYVQEKPVKEGK